MTADEKKFVAKILSHIENGDYTEMPSLSCYPRLRVKEFHVHLVIDELTFGYPIAIHVIYRAGADSISRRFKLGWFDFSLYSKAKKFIETYYAAAKKKREELEHKNNEVLFDKM